MSKKQEALSKAKESWRIIVEWWKELWEWAVDVVWWTTWALGYTLLSWWEKVAAQISESRENNEWISYQERENRKRSTAKLNKKAKTHIDRAWELGETAVQWAWKVFKWWAKVIWHTVKGGYHLIDAWDKAIGERISEKRKEKWERSVSKLRNFFRNNILKLLIAGSVLWYGWTEAVQHFRDENHDKIEVIQWDEKNAVIKELFSSNDVLYDLKQPGKWWQDKRENRYLWKDEVWNNMSGGFWIAERKKVIEWICRMIESWDLEMVMKKADDAWVPRQCVFLALAESWWRSWANSWVAGWYRQFTYKSAKDFWLIDEQWNDYRGDPERSTDAAMKHLKANYDIVCNYNKSLWYNMSESDKWIFAFCMYNWSPKLVKKWIIACKWDANKYPDKQTNHENRNYVSRILGIQDALYKIFKEYKYDTQKIKSIHLNNQVEITEADKMFEEYLKDKIESSNKENLKKLEAIKSKYKEEYESGKISNKYYNWAIRIIDEEISSIE